MASLVRSGQGVIVVTVDEYPSLHITLFRFETGERTVLRCLNSQWLACIDGVFRSFSLSIICGQDNLV